MRRASVIVTLIAASFVAALAAENRGPAMFDAVAEVTSPQGTRSMPVQISVSRPISLDEADFYRHVLRDGGQQALISAIHGSDRGRLVLGAMQFPLDIVVAEPTDRGTKYTVVTSRAMRFDEDQLQGASREYPFSVAVFDAPDMGRGEGTLVPRAALSITDGGHVEVQAYDGIVGRLKDMKRR
jgi:hypothetical protein